MRTKYKLTIAYDGTNYSGWQIQPNAVTIQELLQNAIQLLAKHEVSVIGSGRTDAGVHALAQVAHFTSERELDPALLFKALNGNLPLDIRIKEVEIVPNQFHARYSARGKIYNYHLHLDKALSPFKRLYSYHFREKIDLKLLEAATKQFLGKHDFTSFANEAHAGAAAKNPIRTIKRIDVIPEEGGVYLQFEADSFLYKMVRNIVGMLLDVSRGYRGIEEIAQILEAKDRRLAGLAAPPHGLFLVKVHY